MKSITLNRADATNIGTFCDAGASILVGDGPDMIDAARAQTAVDAGLASVDPARPTRPATQD